MLYINDLPNTLVCHCMMFADDTKSFIDITDVADMNRLQNDLHLMEKWSKNLAPAVPSWEMCCYVCGNMVEHNSSVFI